MAGRIPYLPWLTSQTLPNNTSKPCFLHAWKGLAPNFKRPGRTTNASTRTTPIRASAREGAIDQEVLRRRWLARGVRVTRYDKRCVHWLIPEQGSNSPARLTAPRRERGLTGVTGCWRTLCEPDRLPMAAVGYSPSSQRFSGLRSGCIRPFHAWPWPWPGCRCLCGRSSRCRR